MRSVRAKKTSLPTVPQGLAFALAGCFIDDVILGPCEGRRSPVSAIHSGCPDVHKIQPVFGRENGAAYRRRIVARLGLLRSSIEI